MNILHDLVYSMLFSFMTKLSWLSHFDRFCSTSFRFMFHNYPCGVLQLDLTSLAGFSGALAGIEEFKLVGVVDVGYDVDG